MKLRSSQADEVHEAEKLTKLRSSGEAEKFMKLMSS